MFIKWAKRQLSHLKNLWRNKNVAVFIVFLALSATFWFLNSLRKTYVTTIYTSIKLDNLPQGKMINQETTSKLAIMVRGDGFSLLRFNLGNNHEAIAIDLQQFNRFKFARKGHLYILTNDYKQEIASQLSHDFELLSIYPDTLHIGLMNRKTKTVPVKFNASLQFKPSFYQSGPTDISPKSVEVSGPDAIIDTLSAVYTVNQPFNNVFQSIVAQLNLQTVAKLEFNISGVNVVVPVEAYTESKFKVPISVVGVPSGYSVKTFPSEIDLSCLVPLSQFEFINKDLFTAKVDFADIDLEKQSKLKVKLESVPDFVYSIRFEPLFIDFLLERH